MRDLLYLLTIGLMLIAFMLYSDTVDNKYAEAHQLHSFTLNKITKLETQVRNQQLAIDSLRTQAKIWRAVAEVPEGGW